MQLKCRAPMLIGPIAQGDGDEQPERQEKTPGLKAKILGAVDEDCTQVDPCRLERREPAGSLVVTEPTVPVLVECDRDLGRA